MKEGNRWPVRKESNKVAKRCQRSVYEILEEMAADRQRTLSALQDLEEEALDRQGLHPALGETTVLKIFRIIPISTSECI
jgi:hypothetical protein